MVTHNGMTVLMQLCRFKPEILNQSPWFTSLLLKQARERDNNEKTAIDHFE